MTLYRLIKVLEEIALQQPNIRTTIENDVYVLNSKPDTKYGVFIITQNPHNRLNDSNLQFSLNLFYVDRLTQDNDNEIQIQSTGINLINNIINTVIESYDEIEVINSVNFQTFNQKFADACSGVYATVIFSTISDVICAERGYDEE